MMLLLLILLLAISFASGSYAQNQHLGPSDDLISGLPGFPDNMDITQYSGYLDGLNGTKLHYWFVESERDAFSDPLVVWFNGGPGCSSLVGLLEGNGPFRIANMLYIESPVGVGYSYSPDKNYTTTNEIARDNNYAAVKDFLQKFPDIATNELYIFGQSFAGVYVPMLSALLVDDQDVNFQGMGTGNGVNSYKYTDGSIPQFLYHHGFIGEKDWKDMHSTCCQDEEEGYCDFTHCTHPEAIFATLIYMSNGGNVYDVTRRCVPGTMPSMQDFFSALRKPLKEKALLMGYFCVNSSNTILYMNKPEVRQALHIPSDLDQEWWLCSKKMSMDYYSSPREETDMKPYIEKVLHANKRVLMYYGDLDVICNFFGARKFVESLNLKVVRHHTYWSFLNDNQERESGGTLVEYENLIFATIKGGSHMVVRDQGSKAFALFNSFMEKDFTNAVDHSFFKSDNM